MFPVVMRLQIRPMQGTGISVWIPVVLIWILLPAVMTVLFPVFFLAALLTLAWGPGMRLLLSFPLVISVLWNLSGLHIEKRDPARQVLISFR